MNSETKVCQNCKKDFTIEPEDFDFYGKMKVPPPTFCPECRLIRRLLWQNTRNYYKRTLKNGKHTISMYSEDKPFEIIDDREWWSDSWDSLECGQDYDFSKPFFEQFKRLLKNTPLPHLHRVYSTLQNSDYCNASAGLKNCYLISNADDLENCSYGLSLQNCKDCVDIIFANDSELCYEGVNLKKCYKTFFSENCESCRDIWFSLDCLDCSNCFGCVNLRKKQYYIFNEPYSKENYFEKIKEFDTKSRNAILEIKEKAYKHGLKFPRKFMHGRLNVNSTGEYLYNSKNAKHIYMGEAVEDSKYGFYLKDFPTGTKDSYDFTQFGNSAGLIYEASWVGLQVSNLKFCFWNYGVQDMEYCVGCHNSKNLFACVALRKKQYCILNKQYTKEEYEKLVPKIKKHMDEIPYTDEKGCVYKYGEFFSPQLSPFAYNETWAQDYFPLTKKQAIEKGYKWKDSDERDYKIDIKIGDLPDQIKNTKDDILGKVIECNHRGGCNHQCTTAFKIIESEFEFLKRMNLPLPSMCPNCRYSERFTKRNPIKNWHRKCMNEGCNNEFETSYAPDRPEIVYCEQCYNGEVN